MVSTRKPCKALGYRHSVACQSPTRSVNSDNQVTYSFSTQFTIRAAVEVTGYGENQTHRQKKGFEQIEVRCIWSSSVTSVKPSWQLVYDGNEYNVTSAVDREGTRKEFVIEAERKVD